LVDLRALSLVDKTASDDCSSSSDSVSDEVDNDADEAEEEDDDAPRLRFIVLFEDDDTKEED
jgi:hypothetical protein